MLGGFHTTKCVQRCIGKHIKGTGLEGALVETGVFQVKMMESILAATNYVWSVRGIQTLFGAIESVKWNAFCKVHDTNEFRNSDQVIKKFVESLDKKDKKSCLKFFEQLKTEIQCNSLMHFQTHAWSMLDLKCTTIEMVSLTWPPCFTTLFQLTGRGDCEGHSQAIKDLLLFCEADCIKYFQYATWYLEKMQILDQEDPNIHAEFLAEKFVVQTSVSTFKAVSPHMKLEQTIHHFQKSSDGIIGQVKTESYVPERELVYHEILAISNCYSDLAKSKTCMALTKHHMLTGTISKQLSEEINKVREFITERGNSYKTTRPRPLHNITSGLVVLKGHSKLFWNYYDDGKQQYKHFCDKQYVKKSKKLCDTMKKVNLPKFDDKDKK